MDLLLVPYNADIVDVPQWPPFLLASKVNLPHFLDFYVNLLVTWACFIFQIPVAVHMAKDTKANASELHKRLRDDPYMNWAVRECYLSCRNIISSLIEGGPEKK